MSDFPTGWALVRLSDIAAEVRNGISARPEEKGTEPILRISAVRPMRLDMNDTRLLMGPPQQWSGYSLRLDDLLFTRYNGNPSLVGVCARVAQEPERVVVYPDKLIRVRLHGDIASPAFVEKVVNVGISRAAVDDKTKTSAGQVGISGGDLKDVPLPLPPLPEQHRIVAKLEALTEKSRRAKEELDAIPPLLERFRQSVLAAAFRGDLTAEWRAKNPDVEPADKLLQRIRTERRRRWEESELAKMQAKGKTPSDDKWKQKYEDPAEPDFRNGKSELPVSWSWASVADVSECLDSRRRPVNRLERTSRAGVYPYYGANGQVGVIDDYIFDEELLLITEDETFYGRVKPIAYQVAGKCWVNNHAHVLRAVAPMSLSFLRYQLMHYPVEPWLSGTTGRAKLTQAALNELPIVVPPAAEMVEVERILKASIQSSDRTSYSMRAIVEELARLNQGILAKAFRGDLVPQDPTDEPASVLLDRIRAERATAVTTKAKKPTKRR